MRTVTVLLAGVLVVALALVLLMGQMVTTADARYPFNLRTTWTGTVLGHQRSCQGVNVKCGAADCVDGGRMRCGGRVISFDTRAADVRGGLVTTGTLCRRGQPRRRCCPLTWVTVTGEFNRDPSSPGGAFSGGFVHTLEAGASCRRRIYPAGAISLRLVELTPP